MKACWSRWPKRAKATMGSSGSGPALQYGRGGGGREVDVAGHQQLEVLPAGGVTDVDLQALVAEVALVLRDVGSDERQVGLRPEPCHEDDPCGLGWSGFGFGLG